MTDPHRARLFDMARAAGYHLVPADDLAAADAMTAVAIQQARLMRAALVEVRAALETALPTATEPTPSAVPLCLVALQAVRIIAEALDPVPYRVVTPGPEVRTDLERPPLDVVREVIVDHSEAGA